MSWRNIRIFGLAVLIVLNAVFMYLVSTQYSAIGRYTDEEIDNAVMILDNGHLHIDKSLIEKEKKSPVAYDGKIDINKLISIWDEVYSNVSYDLDVISGRSREGKISINSDLEFSFVSIIRPGEYSFDDSKFEEVGEEAETYYESFKTAVFGDKFFEKTNTELQCVGTYTEENGFVYAKFKQLYDGLIVHEGDIRCVFIGGKMIYAEGLLVAVDTDNVLTTNCVDILSILVRENGRVNTEENIDKSIVSIKNGLSFVDASRDKFYLVPTYRIIYSDETESVYDAVTGDYLG